MGVDLEQKLRNIEDELKSMKVCYNTAGSLVTMYVQRMGEITVGGGSGLHDVTIKFTPTLKTGHNNLINLVAVVDSNTYYVAPFTVNPQDGSGDVSITIYSLSQNQKVDVIASGISTGTFTRTA